MTAPDNSEGVVVRIERGTNPFEDLSTQARLRLIVRVLCELVAYGEATDVSAPQTSEPVAASG